MASTPSAYPQVVSRRFASSIPLLSQLKAIFGLVRFPAAPLEKGRPEQRFVFPCLADINRPSTSASQVSTTLGSTQRQQSPNGLAVDAMSIDHLSLRISRRREVGVKPETTSVRGSCATCGRGCFRCRSIKSSTSSRVMRQVRPTRYPDNSPRFKRQDSQRAPSVISGGRTIFATSESEYVLISSASSSITHTLTCVCAL